MTEVATNWNPALIISILLLENSPKQENPVLAGKIPGVLEI